MYIINNEANIHQLKTKNQEFGAAFDSLTSYYNMTLRNISHEFGNALTLINSSLQLIESNHPEVHSFKYWDSVISDVKYLKQLICELSSFNNGENLTLSPVNIVSILNEIIYSMQSITSSSNIGISVNYTNNIFEVLGDSTKLKQVFINIIKNALEACSDNGHINISIDRESNNVIIKISDTGCGMTPDQLNNIFIPMVTYKESGSGLGLPISRKIILAHNGSISVTSIPDIGTIFTITLPLLT